MIMAMSKPKQNSRDTAKMVQNTGNAAPKTPSTMKKGGKVAMKKMGGKNC